MVTHFLSCHVNTYCNESACIKPIHSFQICILGGIVDANDGIGLRILGFYLLSVKLQMDFLVAITSFTVSLPIPSSGWHTDMCFRKWDSRQHH